MMRMMVLIKTIVIMMMGMGMMMMFRQLESLCCTSGCTAVVGQSAITQLNQLPERQDLPELPTLSDLIEEKKSFGNSKF